MKNSCNLNAYKSEKYENHLKCTDTEKCFCQCVTYCDADEKAGDDGGPANTLKETILRLASMLYTWEALARKILGRHAGGVEGNWEL